MNEIDLDKLQRSVKACAKFPNRDCEGCEYKHSFICFHDELMDDFDRCIALLKEQDDKIRQLELALQIMKGTGIKVDTEGR